MSNDFTKEELQKIITGLAWWHQDSGFMEVEEYLPLLAKIQYMIDNYCDHTWTDGSGNMIFCVECQAYGGKR